METRARDRDIVAAEWAGAKRVRVTFSDGTIKTVDLAARLSGRGGVFERIASSDEAFSELYFDPEAGTVCWPGGLDIAPERFESLPDVSA